MMIDYFGVTFTIVLSSYILICVLIQGLLLEIVKPQKKKNTLNNE